MVLRHNIYKERMAETVTDSIRALLLEIADYDVKVFEFIGGEHTSKNVMITAVQRVKKRTKKQKEDLRQELKSLSTLHGLRRQKLADFMDQSLREGGGGSDGSIDGGVDGRQQTAKKVNNRRGMPSL